jgi:hypothetical protein
MVITNERWMVRIIIYYPEHLEGWGLHFTVILNLQSDGEADL